MKKVIFSFIGLLFIVVLLGACSEFAGQPVKIVQNRVCTPYENKYCEGKTLITSTRDVACKINVEKEECEVCRQEKCITMAEYDAILAQNGEVVTESAPETVQDEEPITTTTATDEDPIVTSSPGTATDENPSSAVVPENSVDDVSGGTATDEETQYAAVGPGDNDVPKYAPAPAKVPPGGDTQMYQTPSLQTGEQVQAYNQLNPQINTQLNQQLNTQVQQQVQHAGYG